MSTTLKIKSAYEKAQVKGTHELAPRVGHYLFQTCKMTTTSKGLQVAVMETLWKPLTEISFIENLTFEVAITSFYNKNASGPTYIDSCDLINRMIVVKQVTVLNNVISLIWDVVYDTPLISKPQSLFGIAPMTYNDINGLNGRFGIDDTPDPDQPYDSPDDL